MTTTDDARWMARALRLARRGLYTTDPNPRVGCVLVCDGRVVGEGWHERAGAPHAEVVALRQAGKAARGATCYVTLEPCSHHGRTPPCADALVAAGVVRVVAAMEDPNPRVRGRGLARLRAAGISVACGLMEGLARELNIGFVARMERGRPWLRLKSAASLDGRTAMASGESHWITGPAARRDVQRWRARASAVLTGVDTVLADDPTLTVRPDELGVDPGRQPLRVVVDSRLRTPPAARLFRSPGPVLVATTEGAEAERARALEAAGAEVLALPADDSGRVSLPELFRALAAREVNEIHTEAGARLTGALLAAGLADEWLLYQAPRVLGDAGRGLLHLPELQTLDDAPAWEVQEVVPVGRDWRWHLRPDPSGPEYFSR